MSSTHPTQSAGYVAAFHASSTEPDWLTQRRRASLDRFARDGFPSPRQEIWRLTDLKALTGTLFTPTAETGKISDEAGLTVPYRIAGTTTLVLRNGRFDATSSDALPNGVTILSQDPGAAEAIATEATSFGALNEAFFSDGVSLRVGTQKQPLHIVHIGHAEADESYHLRNLVEITPSAEATLIESFVGTGKSAYWANSVTAIILGDNAKLEHVKIVADQAQSIHSSNTEITQGADSRYQGFILTTGGLLSRQDVKATLAGPRAFCGLVAASLLRGHQQATLSTLIRHDAPATETDERYKGVIDGHARGVFQGKIRVDRLGQQTNANQLSQSILLSDNARVDTKPELEIFADDVKCSHGATVGELDEDAMFYLLARGIPAEQARAMLIEGFVADAFEGVAWEATRTYIKAYLDQWLGAAA